MEIKIMFRHAWTSSALDDKCGGAASAKEQLRKQSEFKKAGRGLGSCFFCGCRRTLRVSGSGPWPIGCEGHRKKARGTGISGGGLKQSERCHCVASRCPNVTHSWLITEPKRQRASVTAGEWGRLTGGRRGGQGRAKLGHERGKARCRGGRWLGVGALLLCSEGELGALGGVVEGDWSASRLLGQDRWRMVGCYGTVCVRSKAAWGLSLISKSMWQIA